MALAGRDDRRVPPQGQRVHGDVGLVAQVLLGRAQARDSRPAPGPGHVRLGLSIPQLRAPVPGLGVRGLLGRRAGEGLPPQRRADPGPPVPDATSRPDEGAASAPAGRDAQRHQRRPIRARAANMAPSVCRRASAGAEPRAFSRCGERQAGPPSRVRTSGHHRRLMACVPLSEGAAPRARNRRARSGSVRRGQRRSGRSARRYNACRDPAPGGARPGQASRRPPGRRRRRPRLPPGADPRSPRPERRRQDDDPPHAVRVPHSGRRGDPLPGGGRPRGARGRQALHRRLHPGGHLRR